MTSLKSHRGLEVWKRSIDLVETIYRVSSGFPAEEKFGLTSQIRRAAASVPANTAEGAARTGAREFLQFLSVSSGSLAEVETFLILAAGVPEGGRPEIPGGAKFGNWSHAGRTQALAAIETVNLPD